MSRTSCIPHPASEPLIIIHRWQLEFCTNEEGKVNECAAALLSFLEYWHNNKLDISERNRSANDAFERESKGRPLPESLLQWHSTAEIEAGLLIFKRSSIQAAIDFLVNKGAVEVHRNPVLKYDNTKHFLFRPEVLIEWLRSYEPNSAKPPAENSRPPAENGHASTENSRTIPETSSEKTTESTTKTTKSASPSPTKRHVRRGSRETSSSDLFVSSEEAGTKEKNQPSVIAPSPGLMESVSRSVVEKANDINGSGSGLRFVPVDNEDLAENIAREFKLGRSQKEQLRLHIAHGEDGREFVLQCADITRSTPTDNVGRTFWAAFRDEWQPAESNIKPAAPVDSPKRAIAPPPIPPRELTPEEEAEFDGKPKSLAIAELSSEFPHFAVQLWVKAHYSVPGATHSGLRKFILSRL